MNENIKEGDLVDVYGADRETLVGRAIVTRATPMQVLTTNNRSIDANFLVVEYQDMPSTLFDGRTDTVLSIFCRKVEEGEDSIARTLLTDVDI